MHSTRGNCFCGNAFSSDTTKDNTLCNLKCRGDDTETCGGSITYQYDSVFGSSKCDSFLLTMLCCVEQKQLKFAHN